MPSVRKPPNSSGLKNAGRTAHHIPANIRPDALAAPIAELKLAEARKVIQRQADAALQEGPAQVAANVAALMRNPAKPNPPPASAPAPPSNSTVQEVAAQEVAPQDDSNDAHVAIRELFDVPNPESSREHDILRKADMTALSDALGWKVENILKGCKANAYGVVEYENFKKLMVHRLTKNYSGEPAAFAVKMRANAAKARNKIHPTAAPQEAATAVQEAEPARNAVDIALQLAFASANAEPDESAPGAVAEQLQPVSAEQEPHQQEPQFGFRCQKCRMVLFKSSDVDESGEFNEASEMKRISGKCWNKGSKGTMDDSVKLTSLFICESVAAELGGDEIFSGADSGKLYCPGCEAKLGSFKWSGEQDNRGHYHAPSFNIPKSKVDRMPL